MPPVSEREREMCKQKPRASVGVCMELSNCSERQKGGGREVGREKENERSFRFVPSAFVVTVTMLSRLSNVRAG